MAGLTNFPGGLSSMGVPLTGGGNPFGNYWFVSTAANASDGNSGKDTVHAFATIAKAISKGVAGDNIILSPGTHSVDVSASALVPLADMQFIGAIPPIGGKPSTIITADADDGVTLVDLDVDGTGWHGIEFLLVAGGATAVDLFDVSQTTAVTGAVFNDCWFNLNSVDKAGKVRAIALDDGTNATTGLVVRNCRFVGGDATTGASEYIDIGVGGAPSALIEGCTFELESADGDAIGINFLDPGAVTSYAITIRNNDFIGPDDGGGDAEGIVIAGAADDAEVIGMMRFNFFSGSSANPITKDQGSASQLMNYRDDGAGGAIFDPLT